MKPEYWIVNQTVPLITERLRQRHESASILHGARMFQILFASGWEPTAVSIHDIDEFHRGLWSHCEREAFNRKRISIRPFLMPYASRLPEKHIRPENPEDAMMPIRFVDGDKTFIVPLICQEVGIRNNGVRFLDIVFDHCNDDGPYLDRNGESYGEEFERGGIDLQEHLLPTLNEGIDEIDFDDALREYIFDVVSAVVMRQGIRAFHKEWEGHSAKAEREDIQTSIYNARMQDLIAKARDYPPPFPLEFKRECLRIHKHYMDQRQDLDLETRYAVIVEEAHKRFQALLADANGLF